MELSGFNMWLLAGTGALILLLLMLRFALRPKRPETRGLGLDQASSSASGKVPGAWSPVGVNEGARPTDPAAATSTSARAGGSEARTELPAEKPLASYFDETVPASGARTVAGVAGGTPTSERSSSGASVAPHAPTRADAHRAAGECPKCGGRFLRGEMEGPTLMVDGVSREDFQPLLSARECSDCGYLELYTRPPQS